ncbi:hypothetical protein [Piscinibacter sp. HJYY11]|uniref:hypothetical protein n=1 Tax=Piscinibacter sp. HJYY11 TaxID=2801333 RepID=UPI00191D032D|nr:hypothetical protein [Piscinibacter sp. HJYY11]MBL0726440.1 hypothetical protein [Piscinibacter sp. HJYY11]
MRKLLSTLLLSVFVLLAQHGAVLHELSHLAAASSPADGDAEHRGAAVACASCLALSHVGLGVALDAEGPRLRSDLAFEAHAWANPPDHTATPVPPRSRGPPVHL